LALTESVGKEKSMIKKEATLAIKKKHLYHGSLEFRF